jgi:hypothetical protein
MDTNVNTKEPLSLISPINKKFMVIPLGSIEAPNRDAAISILEKILKDRGVSAFDLAEMPNASQ